MAIRTDAPLRFVFAYGSGTSICGTKFKKGDQVFRLSRTGVTFFVLPDEIKVLLERGAEPYRDEVEAAEIARRIAATKDKRVVGNKVIAAILDAVDTKTGIKIDRGANEWNDDNSEVSLYVQRPPNPSGNRAANIYVNTGSDKVQVCTHWSNAAAIRINTSLTNPRCFDKAAIALIVALNLKQLATDATDIVEEQQLRTMIKERVKQKSHDDYRELSITP